MIKIFLNNIIARNDDMIRFFKITLAAITVILGFYSFFNNNIPVKYLMILVGILSLINGIGSFKNKDKTNAYLNTAVSVVIFIAVFLK